MQMKNSNSQVFRVFKTLFGQKQIQVKQNDHLNRLGKQCPLCKKSIIHRDSISVCQCYLFAHKTCLINTLQSESITECSTIKCSSCNHIVEADIRLTTIKNLAFLSLYLLVCLLAMLYLVNFKNNQKQQLRQQQINNSQRQYLPFITVQQAIVFIILTIFGSAFWISLMGIFFKKKISIGDIHPTNIQIKVSAFEGIEQKIREQSQQQILLKNDL